MTVKEKKAVQAQQRVNRIRHRMEGVTSLVQGSRHLCSNVSDVVVRVPQARSHFHTFHGITTTSDGHRHTYSGRTGLSINGTGRFGGGRNHFHRFSVVTGSSNGHRHVFSGTTTGNRFISDSRPPS